MLRTLLLAAASLIGLAPVASAQTMEFACPKPGTTFTFDSGTTVTSRSQEGMACVMQNVGGSTFKVHALLFDNPGPDGKDTSAFIAAIKPERLWPLQLGKKIEATYSVGGRTWNYILSVARFEKRAGPGGALFDTFVIEMNEQGDKGQRSLSRWSVSTAEKYVLWFDYSDGAGKANRARVDSIKH
jgi:hypothetical protein